MTEESEVPAIYVIHGETIDPEKGCYHIFYALLQFNKQGGVDGDEDQADMEADKNEEEMEDMIIENEREHHRIMVFEDN